MIKRVNLKLFVTLIILIGFTMDYLSDQGIFLITISKEYIYHIYAAIATIVAISATILTIMVNSLNERYYGFSVKEIANFRHEYLKVSEIIPFALFSILLSTLSLALDLINTLVGILIAVVFLIISASNYIWKLISDDEFCAYLVLNEINFIAQKNNSIEIEYLLKRLFKSLKNSIETYGILNIDNQLNTIKETIDKTKKTDQLLILIDKELKSTFKTVSNTIGYIPAIEKVLNLYNSIGTGYSNYDRREILYEPLKNIQFLNDKEISSSTMIMISNGLEAQDNLEDSEQMFILYQYFNNIYLNELINKRVKNSLLEDLIFHVSDFRYSNENKYDRVKQKVLLHILKDFVLVNKEIKDAKDIFIMISKALNSKTFFQNEKLFETIAIIYLAIYLYSEGEWETLTEDHRKEIKDLVHSYENDIHTSRISFSTVLKSNFKQIVMALWKLSDQKYEELRFFEYFPQQFGVKSVVWDKSAGICFAIYNYLLSYYDYWTLPNTMIDICKGVEEKRDYISSMLDLFDFSTHMIKESNLREMKEISDWIGFGDLISSSKQKEIYDNLNKEMQIMEDKKLQQITPHLAQLSTINDLLKQKFGENRDFYGYNQSLNIKDTKEIHFRPFIVDSLYCNDEINIANRLAIYFGNFINDQVKKDLPEVKLSFDIEGVRLLLIQLKENNFNRRNYRYVDDLALGKEVRASREYNELCELIESITYENTKPINSLLFFKDGCLDYNIEITEYKREELTDDECSIYAENFKVGEGIYKLERAYLNKSKAMEAIKKRFLKELISFRYNSNLSCDCGIRIGFKYK